MQSSNRKEFIEGIDYYLEDGRVVFTSKYLAEKGICCGTGCRHCIYDPVHQKGATALQNEWTSLKTVEGAIYKKINGTTTDTSECKKPDE